MNRQHSVKGGLRRATGLIALTFCGGCASFPQTSEDGMLRVTGEPLVGALGELSDVAEVGYGVSATYSHPVGTFLENDLYLEGTIGLSWNDVSDDIVIYSVNPLIPSTVIEVEDTARGIRGGLGARLDLAVGSESLTPYLAAGVSYWDYSSDIGDSDGPGPYVGAGVDWDIAEDVTFGISGKFHFLFLDGAVDGLGVVPVLGLSVGYRF